MNLIKKTLILTLLPLILTSCGVSSSDSDSSDSDSSNSSNSSVPVNFKGYNVSAPMLYSAGPYVPYTKDSKGQFVPLGEFVYPFNTSIVMSVFYDANGTKPTDIAESFEHDISYYHSLFDRHYYYKDLATNKILNNVRTINESYGTNTPIKVDKPLFDILYKSKKMMKISGGKFNISIGNLSSLWDEKIDEATGIYGREDEYVNLSIKQGKIIYFDPSESEVKEALKSVLTTEEMEESLVLNESDSTVTFKSVARLDELNIKPSLTLGGIGKGEATELFANSELAQKYCVRINSGTSSIKFTNPRLDGNKWGISFSNPIFYEENLAVGMIREIQKNEVEYMIRKDGSFGLSTSGYYQQYYFDKETKQRRHHIINPETGYSNYYTDLETYEGAFDAVTILMDDAGLSDMYTTALMNTSSLEEANSLLVKLNEGFNTDASALYFKRGKDNENSNIKEILYVPTSLESSFEVVKDLKYPLATKLVTY